MFIVDAFLAFGCFWSTWSQTVVVTSTLPIHVGPMRRSLLFTLRFHHTWLENPRKKCKFLGTSQISMVHFPACHVWWNQIVLGLKTLQAAHVSGVKSNWGRYLYQPIISSPKTTEAGSDDESDKAVLRCGEMWMRFRYCNIAYPPVINHGNGTSPRNARCGTSPINARCNGSVFPIPYTW